MTGSSLRWVAVLAFVGLAAACSQQGPDGLAGRGGTTMTGGGGLGDVPLGGSGGKGGSAVAGSGGGNAGKGGSAVAGSGGAGGAIPGAEDLSCLKSLFADCPTIPGTCSARDVGVAGSGGNPAGKICYASGTTVMTDPYVDCAGNVGQRRYSGKVYKPDGSLCYSYARVCECGSACETTTYTFRDAAGELVATGTVSLSTTLTCANGDSCPGLPAPGGGGRGGGYNCQPYLPGFQCVVDGNCP